MEDILRYVDAIGPAKMVHILNASVSRDVVIHIVAARPAFRGMRDRRAPLA